MPRTRCSTASATTALTCQQPRRLQREPRRQPRCLLPWPRQPLQPSSSLGVIASATGSFSACASAAWKSSSLVGLASLTRRGAFGARQALELLPVTGDLGECLDGLGGLCAHGQPVLSALGIDVDQRGLFLGVVLADGLDRTAVTTGARVGDDNAVLSVADLAEAGELDFDSHSCSLSFSAHNSAAHVHVQFSDPHDL